MPARLGFWTSPDGSQTPLERLRIDSNGNVTVKSSSDNQQPRLRVESYGEYGEIKADGNGSIILSADPDFNANDSYIGFQVDGSEKARIDSNGNLNQTSTGGVSYFKGSSEYLFGSNTSSPPSGGSEAKMQVHEAKTRATLSLNAYMNNAGGPVLQFVSSRSGTVGTLGTKSNNNDYLGDIRFYGDNGTNYNSLVNVAQILVRQKSSISNGDTTAAGEISFKTCDSTGGNVNERMLIGSSGDVFYSDSIYFGGVQGGISNDWGRLNVVAGNVYGTSIQHNTNVVLTNEQGTTSQAMVLGDTSSGTNGKVLWGVSVNGASSNPTTGSESGWSEKARVEGNGDFVISGSYTPSGSDDRLKKNKVGITSALSKVCAMEGFTFEWNDVADKIGMSDGDRHFGLSAQTVEPLAPEVVVVNDMLVNPDDGTNDYKTIRYDRLVPMLVEAIKDLKTENDELKSRISALEG
tara:strand:- start:79 stop:1467 length:1389 start_codon:yes stop_codon:yes gene_type:complete